MTEFHPINSDEMLSANKNGWKNNQKIKERKIE